MYTAARRAKRQTPRIDLRPAESLIVTRISRAASCLLRGGVVLVKGFDLANPEVEFGAGGGATRQVTELLSQAVEPGPCVVGVKVGGQGGDHEPRGGTIALDDPAKQVAHSGTLILATEVKPELAHDRGFVRSASF